MKVTSAVLFSLMMGIGACSSSGGGGSSKVNGTIGGAPIATTDTIGLTGQILTQNAVLVFITNQSGTCGIVQGGRNPANTSILQLNLVSASSVPPGTYNIGPNASGTIAAASFGTTDSACQTTSAHQATAGSITLTTITSTTLTGAFDLTMDSGDHVSGTFAAPVCATDLAKLVNSPTMSSCGH